MRKTVVCIFTGIMVLFAVAQAAHATTWAPEEVACPNCKAVNTFQTINSYGSYIYEWPSKYEYVFRPYTAGEFLYSCRKCRLTLFMPDFEEVPKDKLTQVNEILKKCEMQGGYSKYTDIPMSERLRVAEQTYMVLDRDDEFWCRFYRVVGYHLEKEIKFGEAAAARRKALGIAEKMRRDEKYKGLRKEILLISGAMRHFLGDDPGAMNDSRKARELKYENPKMDKADSEDFDVYLSKLLTDYIKWLETPPGTASKGTTPRKGDET